MEEMQNQTETSNLNQVPPQSTNLSVDQRQKKSSSKWVLIFIGLLILGGAGIFFFTKPNTDSQPTPTPLDDLIPADDTSYMPSPTPTPEPVVKTDISIEIQNGTGISGEAAYLQEKLKALGFSDIKTGNASSTDNTDTILTFSKTTPQTVQDEIKQELDKLYKTVNIKTSSTQKVSVMIITGLRTGQTSKPSPTTVSATSTPTATGSPSPSPTTPPAI